MPGAATQPVLQADQIVGVAHFPPARYVYGRKPCLRGPPQGGGQNPFGTDLYSNEEFGGRHAQTEQAVAPPARRPHHQIVLLEQAGRREDEGQGQVGKTAPDDDREPGSAPERALHRPGDPLALVLALDRPEGQAGVDRRASPVDRPGGVHQTHRSQQGPGFESPGGRRLDKTVLQNPGPGLAEALRQDCQRR